MFKVFRDLSHDPFRLNRIRLAVAFANPQGDTFLDSVDMEHSTTDNLMMIRYDLTHPDNAGKKPEALGNDKMMHYRFDFTDQEAKAIFEELSRIFLGSEASTTAELITMLKRERERNERLTEHLISINNTLLSNDGRPSSVTRVPRTPKGNEKS